MFDVANADAMNLIKIAEDRAFLTEQRSARKAYMSGIDVALSQEKERSRKRKKRLEETADSEKMRADDKRSACVTCEADYSDGHIGNQSFTEGNDDD